MQQQIDFSTLTHSRFFVFAIPNIINIAYLNAPSLRIAIHDAPSLNPLERIPRVAALIVHYNLSRLIIVGNNLNPNVEPLVYNRPPAINPEDKETVEGLLKFIVLCFYPYVCFPNGLAGLPQPLFLTYQDDVVCRVIERKFVGPRVGEFLVEDVELESKEFRRRLIFRRMPNLIQSQAILIPKSESDLEGLGLESLRNMEGVVFLINRGVLVEPYLNAMVSALFLIAFPVNQRVKQRIRLRALCLGVRGGCLLSFLRTQLHFDVVGVEVDEAVVTAARNYFALNNLPAIELIVGDAIDLIEDSADKSKVSKYDHWNADFDVVMVDLVINWAGIGITAPPPRLIFKSTIQAMRSCLHDHGLLVIHVISPNHMLEALIEKLKEVFYKVYRIDTNNDRDFVLIATLTPVASNDHANSFLERLRYVSSESYINSKQELSIVSN